MTEEDDKTKLFEPNKKVPERMALRWLGQGWRIYRENLGVLMICGLFFLARGQISLALHYGWGREASRIMSWAGYIINPAIDSGYFFFCLMLVRGRNGDIKDFLAGFRNFGKVWVTWLILMLAMMGGLIMLVIPAIVIFCKYWFAAIAVIDKKSGPIESLRYSGKITYGYKKDLFLMDIPGLLIAVIFLYMHFAWRVELASQNLTFVGIMFCVRLVMFLLTGPWITASFVYAYDDLDRRYEAGYGPSFLISSAKRL